MIIPHEFLIWDLGSPVITIGTNFEFESYSILSGSIQDIDESYHEDRRRGFQF